MQLAQRLLLQLILLPGPTPAEKGRLGRLGTCKNSLLNLWTSTHEIWPRRMGHFYHFMATARCGSGCGASPLGAVYIGHRPMGLTQAKSTRTWCDGEHRHHMETIPDLKQSWKIMETIMVMWIAWPRVWMTMFLYQQVLKQVVFHFHVCDSEYIERTGYFPHFPNLPSSHGKTKLAFGDPHVGTMRTRTHSHMLTQKASIWK